MPINKVVIPAAGYGTRFLPATKASPKEMMPIVDKPVIQYVVEEAVSAGVEQVVIITGSNKRAIEDHFDYNFELENRLQKSGKDEQYKEMRAISDMADFTYVRQKEQLGNGHAILCAERVVGNEPFIVLWGDEFVCAAPSRCQQLIEAYEKFKAPIISVIRTDKEEDTNKYGFVQGEQVENGIHRVREVVEKPGPGNAPSNLASVGGFLLTPEVFTVLKELPAGKGGEIWLADAISQMAKKGEVYACEIRDSVYYDCGGKLEYLKANIDFALKRPELASGLKQYMRQVLDQANMNKSDESVDKINHLAT